MSDIPKLALRVMIAHPCERWQQVESLMKELTIENFELIFEIPQKDTCLRASMVILPYPDVIDPWEAAEDIRALCSIHGIEPAMTEIRVARNMARRNLRLIYGGKHETAQGSGDTPTDQG